MQNTLTHTRSASQDAPFPPAVGSGQVTAYIDCSEMRLGDRMACAWFAQHRHDRNDERFALIDRHPVLSRDFPLTRYFPDTFVDWSPEDIAKAGLPRWDQGNLWITVTNAFAASPLPGRFEHIPPAIVDLAAQLRARRTGQGLRVLIHVLDDAPYNLARRWRRQDADLLCRTLQEQGLEVVQLNPSESQFIGSFEHMLAEMLAADLFIGGDTGPSHVFAMLCPDKPQVAIYPSMQRDQANFAAEQAQLGLSLPWNSLPKRPALQVIQMDRRRSLIWRGWQPLIRRTGCFDGRQVARRILDELHHSPRRPAPDQAA